MIPELVLRIHVVYTPASDRICMQALTEEGKSSEQKQTAAVFGKNLLLNDLDFINAALLCICE